MSYMVRHGFTRSHQNESGWKVMGKQGFVAGPLTVLCILGLVMGTASALIMTATDSGSTADPGSRHAHPDLSDPGQQKETISGFDEKGLSERGICGDELPGDRS